MKLFNLSGTGVSAIHVARTLPVFTICLISLILSAPAGAFEIQSLDQTSVAETSDSRSADDGVGKNLSCAVYLHRAESSRKGFSTSGSNYDSGPEFFARPKSLGLVVGIRIALGPDTVKRNHDTSVGLWSPGARKDAREQAMADYRRCKTRQAIKAFRD